MESGTLALAAWTIGEVTGTLVAGSGTIAETDSGTLVAAGPFATGTLITGSGTLGVLATAAGAAAGAASGILVDAAAVTGISLATGMLLMDSAGGALDLELNLEALEELETGFLLRVRLGLTVFIIYTIIV